MRACGMFTRLLALLCLIGLSPALAQAQTTESEEADKGFLTNLLEESLTDAGREVRITNFSGALSSRATIDSLTIADDQGIWLIARGLVLDWDRSALLGGVLDIAELSADEIELPRLPATDDSLPPPEAGEFRVPELPVELRIGRLSADRIVLGRAVLGQAAELTLTGSARLADGGGAFNLEARRIDDRQGRVRLRGSYTPQNNQLMVDLGLLEASGGIVATALNIPDRPSILLTLAGDGPVEDFSARLKLATAGVERLTGTAGLTADAGGNRVGRLDIEGDLTALFPEAERAFLAGRSELRAQIRQEPDGTLDLQQLALRTRYADLTGQAALGPGGGLQNLSLTGELASRDGTPVPLPGGDFTLGRGALSVTFDVQAGEDWQARATLRDVAGPGLDVAQAQLGGTGVLIPEGQPDAGLRGTFALDLAGADFQDAGIARLLGDRLTGSLSVDKSPDRPFAVRDLDLVVGGDDTRLTGNATIEGFATGFRTVLNLVLDAPDLSRIATLSGLAALQGSGDLAVSGEVTPLSGAFDLTVDARTNPLRIGQAEVDQLLNRPTTLRIKARRGPLGIKIGQLILSNAALGLDARGLLSSDESWIDYDASLKDLSLLAGSGVTGRGRADLAGVARFDGAGGSALRSVTAKGRINPGADNPLAVLPVAGQVVRLAGAELDARYIAADGKAEVRALARQVAFAWPGGIETEARAAEVDLRFDGTRLPAGWSGALNLGAQGLTLPDPTLAALVGPAPRIRGQVRQAADGTFAMRGIEATIRALTFTGDATLDLAEASQGGDAGRVLRLDGRAVAPDLSALSSIVNVPLRGETEAGITARAVLDTGALDVDVTGQARRLGAGSAVLDRVLAGNVDYRLTAGRAGQDQPLRIALARFDAPRLSARAEGDAQSGYAVSARLSDLALVAPDFSGPVTASGRVDPLGPEGSAWQVDIGLSGPGNTNARVAGRYAAPSRGGSDLTLRGDVPLGILNPVLAPRRLSGRADLDLALRGALALENLTGRIATSGARLSAPTLSIALDELSLGATMTGGRATLAGAARGRDGGRIDLSGDVVLDGLRADLTVAFAGLRYRRGDVLETRINGRLGVTGSLTGDALIAGALRLDQTEIRVAPSGASTLEDIPAITFVQSSGPATRTRLRAGLGARSSAPGAGGEGGGSGGGARAFGLDIRIDAPGQVFVRGRGLDAELGGSLRITGTTRAPVPQGRLDLIRGRLDILTQRFELDEGSAQVLGDLDPYLRLAASTVKEGYTVSVIVEGEASAPVVSFVSVPELPEDEVLALLIFGRRLERLSPVQALELASAIATLAGRGGIGVIERLRRNFLLDDLDLTTTDNGETAVRAGKYLSENVYSDVTVDTKGEVELNLNLDLSPNVKARGGVSSGGNTSLGIFIEKDY